ncbi:MAG: GAF domain-containing protein [Pseudomonadota bacterium]
MGDTAFGQTKQAAYDGLAKEIAAVIEGETSLVARMATVSNILHHGFDHFFWTGFYQVDPLKDEELVVGPYQGTMGCLRIPFGRGVCGAAARTGEVQIVDDVHAFPGHIACDPNSRSEIVIPVRGPGGALIAVLDVDSDQPGMFDDCDGRNLSAIVVSAFAG